MDPAAASLDWSVSKVSRVENGIGVIRRRELEQLLDLYMVAADRRRDLLVYFDEVAARPHRLTVAADHANMLREWAPLVIPEVLQTTAYRRAVLTELQPVQLTPPSEIEAAVEDTLTRQMRLVTGLPPLTLEAIIGEAALGNGFGDAAVMRSQLEQLIARAALPSVRMRIMRTGNRAGGPRSLCAFSCLSFPPLQSTTLPDVVTIPAMIPIELATETDTWPHIVAFRRLWELADPDPVPILRSHLDRWTKAPAA
jgi:uncharacterized protein DUF5753/helix-turn-helix protein